MPAARETMRVVICVNMMRGPRGKCCGQSGSPAIADALENGARARRLDLEVERIVCLGKCDDGPNLKIVGGGFRQHLTLDDVPRLLDELAEEAGTKEDSPAVYPGG